MSRLATTSFDNDIPSEIRIKWPRKFTSLKYSAIATGGGRQAIVESVFEGLLCVTYFSNINLFHHSIPFHNFSLVPDQNISREVAGNSLQNSCEVEIF